MSDQNSMFISLLANDLCVAASSISFGTPTKGTFMCVATDWRGGGGYERRGSSTETNQRPGERPGRARALCALDNEEADFVRDVLDLVGDKWSVLISTRRRPHPLLGPGPRDPRRLSAHADADLQAPAARWARHPDLLPRSPGLTAVDSELPAQRLPMGHRLDGPWLGSPSALRAEQL